mmetsp:Transcript_9972/g.11441  ORF Transcript_9972/g.11441 Transcript_9972/m.11441 type:complete len:240 (+) Transcript_9972:182-901(+)
MIYAAGFMIYSLAKQNYLMICAEQWHHFVEISQGSLLDYRNMENQPSENQDGSFPDFNLDLYPDTDFTSIKCSRSDSLSFETFSQQVCGPSTKDGHSQENLKEKGSQRESKLPVESVKPELKEPSTYSLHDLDCPLLRPPCRNRSWNPLEEAILIGVIFDSQFLTGSIGNWEDILLEFHDTSKSFCRHLRRCCTFPPRTVVALKKHYKVMKKRSKTNFRNMFQQYETLKTATLSDRQRD